MEYIIIILIINYLLLYDVYYYNININYLLLYFLYYYNININYFFYTEYIIIF